jgi:apolipoprotein N-acyltransferase
MYWMFGIFGVLAISFVGLMAAYFGILATLIGLTRDRPPVVRALLIGLFAVAVEWLRGDAWYLRFPWYTIPHALAAHPAWIAPVHWVGVYGMSFLVWLIVALGVLKNPAYWLAIVLLPVSVLALPPVNPPDRRALLVQAEDSERVKSLLDNIPAQAVDLVVLPEYAFPYSMQEALSSKSGPSSVARRLDAPVVFGTVEGSYGQPNFQNVAAVVDRYGDLVDTFPKQRPVPFMLDGRPGTRRPVFAVDGGSLGVAICYDFDAPAIAASLMRQGATVLVAPTGDLITWGNVQHLHHELLLRLRAVENNRWILRATTSGRTETVDPHGVPSAEGIEIGDSGSTEVAFAHLIGISPGGQAFILGPLAAGLTVLVILFYLGSHMQSGLIRALCVRVAAWMRGREVPET